MNRFTNRYTYIYNIYTYIYIYVCMLTHIRPLIYKDIHYT